MNIKNAMDYHKELSDIDKTLEDARNALKAVKHEEDTLVTDDPFSKEFSVGTALGFARLSLEKNIAYFEERKQEIEDKLSNSFF